MTKSQPTRSEVVEQRRGDDASEIQAGLFKDIAALLGGSRLFDSYTEQRPGDEIPPAIVAAFSRIHASISVFSGALPKDSLRDIEAYLQKVASSNFDRVIGEGKDIDPIAFSDWSISISDTVNNAFIKSKYVDFSLFIKQFDKSGDRFIYDSDVLTSVTSRRGQTIDSRHTEVQKRRRSDDEISEALAHLGLPSSTLSFFVSLVNIALTMPNPSEAKLRKAIASTIQGTAIEDAATAPALWARAKQPTDTPPDFVRRHYAERLGDGLTQADIAHLDPELDVALTEHLKALDNAIPENWPFPNWKRDKQTGDTPSAFIKRHYGQWLRADGQGVARSDIRRYDFGLYTALNNWLKHNDMPPDCPLPKNRERTDQLVTALSEGKLAVAGDTAASRELVRRLGTALQTRERRR